MKKLLSFLCLLPALVFGQSNVVNIQKGGPTVPSTQVSNGNITIGTGTSLTPTGSGVIISTGGVATSLPYTGITGVPTVSLLGNATGSTANAEAITLSGDLKFTGTVLDTIQPITTASSPTFAGLTLSSPLTGANGGTGVANTGKTITLGGNLTTSGAFNTTLTETANTSLTLPITGTLATLAGTEALTNKTYNGNTWTAGTGTLTIAAGKTLTQSNTLTYTGTDGSSVNFGAGGTVLYSGGSYVSSIAGTANQITSSASTGAVTLSTPSTFIAPGSVAVTTTLVTGGASFSGTYGNTTIGGVGLSITPDTSAKFQIGRYSSGAPYSYIKMGSTSSGIKISNPGDSGDPYIFESTGRLTLGNLSPSIAAWGTTGVFLRQAPVSITDTSSSGTVSSAIINILDTPTMLASSVTTYTNVANLFVAAPVASTNVSFGTAYGIWNGGKERIDGIVNLTSATAATSTSSGALVLSGASGGLGVAGAAFIGGNIVGSVGGVFGGVTPVTSGTPYYNVQYGNSLTLLGNSTTNAVDGYIMSNAYYNSGFKYVGTGAALSFSMGGTAGTFKWSTASSGTAGNAVTFADQMTLTATAFQLASAIATSTFNATTVSSSISTGAIVTNGGMGVAGAAFIGGTGNFAGAVTHQSTTSLGGNVTFTAGNQIDSASGSALVLEGAASGARLTLNSTTGSAVFTGNSSIAAAMVVLNSNAPWIQTLDVPGTHFNWVFGSQIVTTQTYQIIPSTIAGGTTFSTALFTLNGSTSAVTIGSTSSVSSFPGTTSGTSTTAAAILGKSLGLTENIFVGGTGNFASPLTVSVSGNRQSATFTGSSGTDTIISLTNTGTSGREWQWRSVAAAGGNISAGSMTFVGSGVNFEITSGGNVNVWDATISDQYSNIQTTPQDGVVVGSSSAATAGITVRMSPRLRWQSSAWNSSGGGTAETNNFRAEVLPATVSGTTTAIWQLGYANSAVSAGAYTNVFTVSSAGGVTTGAPTGGAGTWQLGIANSVSPTSPNRTLTVNVGGTTYYIAAKTTDD